MWIIIGFLVVTGCLCALAWRFYDYLVQRQLRAQHALEEARVCIELRDWGLAEQYLGSVLKQHWNGIPRLSLYLLYIRVLREMRRHGEIAPILKRALRMRVYHPHLWIELGHHCFIQREYERSIRAFQSVPEDLLGEQDAANYAQALIAVRDFVQAYRVLQPWMESISCVDMCIAIGSVYFSLEHYLEASDFYACALRDWGVRDDYVQYRLGLSLFHLQRYAEAESYLQPLAHHREYGVLASSYYGLCLAHQGHVESSLSWFQGSAYWHRMDRFFVICAARVAMMGSIFHVAQECWEMVLRKYGMESWDAESFHGYGASLCYQKKYREAEHVYLRLTTQFPNQDLGYRAIAWLVGIGCSERISVVEGIQYAKRAVQIRCSQETLELWSICEARAGNFQEAYRIQEKLVSYDRTREQKRRRDVIMRNLRKKMPISDLYAQDFSVLVAA